MGGGASRLILDLIYPVGIVIEFVNSVDPNECMYGQVWEKLPGGYHLLSTDNDSPSQSSTDASNHIPGEAAQGGIPNITGRVHCNAPYTGATNNSGSALYSTSTTASWSNGQTSQTKLEDIYIDASRCSSLYGTYQGNGDKIIGDHIAAVMWKRTA